MKALRDRTGAVYVEFLIAFLPLLAFFLSLLQLAFVEVSALVTKHAAVTAVRAASVVLADDPIFYDGVPIGEASGARRAAIEAAARARLSPVAKEVRVKLSSGGGERTRFSPDDLATVRVEADYKCLIPIGNRIVCGIGRPTKTLRAEASLPIQGARWEP